MDGKLSSEDIDECNSTVCPRFWRSFIKKVMMQNHRPGSTLFLWHSHFKLSSVVPLYLFSESSNPVLRKKFMIFNFKIIMEIISKAITQYCVYR